LKVHYPRGDIDLMPVGIDSGAFPIDLAFSLPINLRFVCTGECNAFLIDEGRIKKLRFVRVSFTPVGPKSPG
jgi:hypothetical protein